MVARKQALKLAAKVEVDSRQQDRRHVTRVTLSPDLPKR
jgi:hypothetical protein